MSVLLTVRAFGQSDGPDSTVLATTIQNVMAGYTRAFAPQALIYNGKEYIRHDHRIKGTPFYGSDSVQTGTAIYYGVRYTDVPMQYDIERDEVAVWWINKASLVRLNSEKVTQFTLGPHSFIRLEKDSTRGVPVGFYEVLYAGKTQVLARRVKMIQQVLVPGGHRDYYYDEDRFFIQRGDQYQEIKSERAALKLFPGREKPFRRALRSQDLRFKSNRAATLVALAQLADQSTQP